MTVSQYLDQWIAMKKQSLRENTLYSYQGYVDNYIEPELGKLKLSAVKPATIEQWQGKLLATLTARTVAGVRVMLGGMFRHAVKMHLLTYNPVRGAEAPKWKRRKKTAFSPEEANRFMDACKGARFAVCLAFMLNTGLRPEEIIGLRWADLELDGQRGVCRVKEIVLRLPGGGWRFDTPKSESSVRAIGFPGWLIAQLKDLRKQQLEVKMRARHYRHHCGRSDVDDVRASPKPRGDRTRGRESYQYRIVTFSW